MVTTLCFMKYKTRLMVYFGYSAPANRRWQIAIALFGEQRVISAQLALAICLPRQRVASKELSRLDEFLLSASSPVKGWVGILLYGFGFFLPRGPGVPCCT